MKRLLFLSLLLMGCIKQTDCVDTAARQSAGQAVKRIEVLEQKDFLTRDEFDRVYRDLSRIILALTMVDSVGHEQMWGRINQALSLAMQNDSLLRMTRQRIVDYNEIYIERLDQLAVRIDSLQNIEEPQEPDTTVTPPEPPAPNPITIGSYPLLGGFQWSGAHPDWSSRFSLWIQAKTSSDIPIKIHERNPDTKVLITQDWNAGMHHDLPGHWWVKTSTGEYVKIYGNSYKLANLTLPEYQDHVVASSRFDFNYFAGVATDGLWKYPYRSEVGDDIDLDRNEVNDFAEHGEAWVRAEWKAGVESLLRKLRNSLGEKLIICNAGTAFPDYGWQYMNGPVMEHAGPMRLWDSWRRTYFSWMSVAPQPHTLLVEGSSNYRSTNYVPIPKNDFETMRFLLCSTLLGDGYYSFYDYYAGECFYQRYYDEFDANLGKPRGPAEQLTCGAWVRFFDNGVSIANATGGRLFVHDNDLKQSSLYSGPYYVFQGQQDPVFNDGYQFIGAWLAGETIESKGEIDGDGLILLTEPKVLACDIIIDNCDPGCSPSQVPPEYVGNWTQDFETQGDTWRVVAPVNWPTANPPKVWWTQNYKNAGDGTAYVKYNVNIGFPGWYEVFEWHGQGGKNVKTLVSHQDGTETFYIDQTTNIGQGNSLGTYRFFDSGSVTITDQGTGRIVADAIMFRWIGE